MKTVLQSEVKRGDIGIDRESFTMTNFFRGIDVKHVEWRCEDALLRRSFDFETSAAANRVIWEQFNYFEEDVPSRRKRKAAGGRVVRTPAEALEAFMQSEPFRGKRKVAQLLVQQRGCRLLRRGSDGCVPPRCVLTVLLRWMGHGGVAKEMWPDEPSVAVLHEELDGLMNGSRRQWPGSLLADR